MDTHCSYFVLTSRAGDFVDAAGNLMSSRFICLCILLVYAGLPTTARFPPSTVEVRDRLLKAPRHAACVRSTVWALTLTRQVVHNKPVLECLHTLGVQCLLKAQDRQQLCILRNVAVWRGRIYVIQDGKHAHTLDLT